MKILNGEYDSKIKEIVLIHNLTRHYILLGEEIDKNFNSYLQPVKEFRDSYDHILRIFKMVLFDDSTDAKYINAQFEKALGHEYRAFFDVADWFSIICRSAAYDSIKDKKNSVSNIISDFPDYLAQVDVLNNSGKRISEIREKKDIGCKIDVLVNEYQRLMVDLYDAMLYIRKATIFFDKDE